MNNRVESVFVPGLLPGYYIEFNPVRARMVDVPEAYSLVELRSLLGCIAMRLVG